MPKAREESAMVTIPGAARPLSRHLTIREVRVRAVSVPLKTPIKTASGDIPEAPLVLFDLLCEEGVTGSSYVFCYTADALGPTAGAAANIAEAIAGDGAHPLDIDRKLRSRFRLLGVQGLIGMAMAGIYMAVWDAQARAVGLALVSFLGGRPKPIPAYGRYGLLNEPEAADAAEKAAQAGFRGMKVKVGHEDVADDIAVIRAIRRQAGSTMAIMVDYNQCLSVAEAIHRARLLDGEGLHWIEEPTFAEDVKGHAKIAQAATTPDPDRRKLVGRGGHDQERGRGRVRSRHGGRHEDRRSPRVGSPPPPWPRPMGCPSPATSSRRSAATSWR